MNLSNQVAVVTGAGRGPGRAISLKLAGAGAAVVAAARTATELESLAAGIRAAGGTALGVLRDVSDPAQAERLISTAADAFGGQIDVLVNNAGRTFRSAVMHIETADWLQTLGVNLSAPSTAHARWRH